MRTDDVASESLTGQWVGTVELAETVLVPPLSVRIARGRVIKRGDPIEVKTPENLEILVDTVGESLPGILWREM